MPISFKVADHPTESVNGESLVGPSAADILHDITGKRKESQVKELFQYGLSGTPSSSSRDLTAAHLTLIPATNGFVGSVMRAYNDHHALVLRPDDVWLAVLSQFSFFVSGRSEALRAAFVPHEDRKPLVVRCVGSRHTVDFARLARQMVDAIDECVVDPALRAWMMPAFSTTTDTDRTVAAVLGMATLKDYFTYEFYLTRCGIPRVTLEGEKADWEEMLRRVEKLKEYGVEAIAWYHLLRPVLARFAAAFDDPESQDNVLFWENVASRLRLGSGVRYYDGWINAFCVFDQKGNWNGAPLALDVTSVHSPDLLSAKDFWATYGCAPTRSTQPLVLDDTPYHAVNTNLVPLGYARVDVKVSEEDRLREYDCEMVAGVVATRVSGTANEMVSPVGGWWLYEKA